MNLFSETFEIPPTTIPKLFELVQYYDQSLEVLLTDEQVTVNWRDHSAFELMDLDIESEKDERWARVLDKLFERLKDSDSKAQQLDKTLKENEKLLEEIKLLKNQKFGTSSEQNNPKLNEASNDESNNESSSPKVNKRTKESYTGRSELPDHLARERVTYDIPPAERQCACCNGKIHLVGEVISEKEIVIPEKYLVRQIIKKKYVCHSCDKFFVAKSPKTMLPGSSYDSPEYLAGLATKRFIQGMPYYRIESYLNSINVPANRSTLSSLMSKVCDKLYPLLDSLRTELINQTVIHADETTMQVLKEPGRKAQTDSFLWLYRSGEHEKNQIVLFDYQQTRSGDHPKNFLSQGNYSFNGYLCVDGYSGYNKVTGVNRVGCMAHLRRKFDEALKVLPNGGEGSHAQTAIKMIAELYGVEKRIKTEPPDKKYELRQRLSVPLLNDFKNWLDEIVLQVVPKTLLGKAVSYAIEQWSFVSRYVECGELAIDNNVAERDIKSVVIGRKNWLFADSVGGAYANATMYSLVATARANNIDPYEYLLKLFETFPNLEKTDDISMLLPWNIFKQEEIEVKIAA